MNTHNQYDNDLEELTPPDGHSPLHVPLPPNASHEQMVVAINRSNAILVKIFEKVDSLHSDICPDPEAECIALERIEKLNTLRRRDNRWMVLVGIIAGGFFSLAGSWLSRNTTEAAAAEAAKVAIGVAKEEVQKAQKSTGDIAFAAGRDGAKLGAREEHEALMHQLPMLIRK